MFNRLLYIYIHIHCILYIYMHIYENVLFIDKDAYLSALHIRLVGIFNFNLKHYLIFKIFFLQNILAT